jgi:hypothetical protein
MENSDFGGADKHGPVYPYPGLVFIPAFEGTGASMIYVVSYEFGE